jgi:hypothetical protein
MRILKKNAEKRGEYKNAIKIFPVYRHLHGRRDWEWTGARCAFLGAVKFGKPRTRKHLYPPRIRGLEKNALFFLAFFGRGPDVN